jgi:hypothetical protein
MKCVYPLFCVAALGACDSTPSMWAMSSLTGALKPGMTEQQLAEVSNNRAPDRVVMAACGIDTPKPFTCKVLSTMGCCGPVSTIRSFRSFWRMSEDSGKLTNGSDRPLYNEKTFGRGDTSRHLCCVLAAACPNQPSADWNKLEDGRQPSSKPVGFHHETCVRAVVSRSVAADVTNHDLLAVWPRGRDLRHG